MVGLTIVIPAAGASSRMRGGDKLLELIAGQACLARQAGVALATGVPVVVTLRPTDAARRAVLAGLNLTVLTVADAASGMAASLRAAAAHATGGMMILPADMPDLDSADLRAVIDMADQNPGFIVRGASAAGVPGHPVILPADLIAELAGLTGDQGARAILTRHHDRILTTPLPGTHALTDLDTPEDWADWRSRRQ